MKFFIIAFLIFSSTHTFNNLEDVRNKFPNIENLKEANAILSNLESDKSLTAQAYCSAMYFMKARYAVFPFTKYSNFNKGKQQLDKLIIEHSNNIEFRYLRFVFQNKIPKFLKYNNNLEEDFRTITLNFESSDLDKKMKLKIINVLIMVPNLSTNQYKQLNELKSKF